MKLSKQSFYFARDGENLLNIALTNLSFVLEGSCLSAFFIFITRLRRSEGR